VPVVTSNLTRTCVVLSHLFKKPKVPLWAEAWQFFNIPVIQAHVQALIAERPKNYDGVIKNHDEDLELCSPNI
jgi:hypothetical protein